MLLKQKYSYWSLLLIAATLLVPTLCFSEANIIFKENNNAIVVIVSYDGKGNPIGQGSGFIVRGDGAIVTNYHVIENARTVEIKIGDKVYEVEGLIHQDMDNDVVILKAKAKNLNAVKIGDIKKLEIGEKVYVISSPQGLENTISEGILSGIREIDSKRKILQITAPISAGSSGGAVFNKNGEVIGIATFILKESQNLNFAMPINIIGDKISNRATKPLKDAEFKEYRETAEYWNLLGIYLSESGLHNDSLEAFKRAIRIQPDDAEAHNNLGTAYGNLGMHREAIEAFKQAIRIQPDDSTAFYNLGTAYGQLGMYREAVKVFKQAIRIKPDYVNALYNIGIAFGLLGMYREEIEAYKQVIHFQPDYVNAHCNIGTAYGKLGMYREQARAYKQAIRIKPEFAVAHYNLGLTYLDLNERGSALKEYKILKTLDPDLANKLFNLIYK